MSKVKNKTSEAQLRASKKWDDANKEKKRQIFRRSTAKNYILNADREELDQIKDWVIERETALKDR